MTRQPILEPTLLYGGYPPGELRHKFLMAAESRALDISDPDFPEALTPIHLPGHSLNMIGIRTPDDVLYIADSLCSQATLQKYRLCYLYDPGAPSNPGRFGKDGGRPLCALHARLRISGHGQATGTAFRRSSRTS